MTLYKGLRVAGGAGIAIALLLFIENNPAADVAMAALSVVLIVEGLGLAFNWRGGTHAMVTRLRSETPPSYLALVSACAWRVSGVFIAVMGFTFFAGALSDLVN